MLKKFIIAYEYAEYVNCNTLLQCSSIILSNTDTSHAR